MLTLMEFNEGEGVVEDMGETVEHMGATCGAFWGSNVMSLFHCIF